MCVYVKFTYIKKNCVCQIASVARQIPTETSVTNKFKAPILFKLLLLVQLINEEDYLIAAADCKSGVSY